MWKTCTWWVGVFLDVRFAFIMVGAKKFIVEKISTGNTYAKSNINIHEFQVEVS